MSEEFKEKLHLFFPDLTFTDDSFKEDFERGEILFHKSDILPFLQTALLDEKVLEVELNGLPRVYFSRLKDDIPDLVEDEVDGEMVMVNPADYNEGDYLTAMTHIVTLPLEPGMGNLYLRHSRTIILRMFTNTFGVEIGTTFDSQIKIRELPVLRLNYPSVARIVRNAREFRAKVPEQMEFLTDIEIDQEGNIVESAVVDISIKGMAFSITKEDQPLFALEQEYSFKLYIDEQLLAKLSGRVAHLSKVRKRVGIEYVCGISFDLETRTVAASIEAIVATVQRAHLKSLAEKSQESGIDLIA